MDFNLMSINLTEIYEKNKNSIIEIGLISKSGELKEFIAKNDKSLDEKNRIIASILASISLGGRASSNLVNQSTKKITLKGEKSTVFILILENDYLYVKSSKSTFEADKILKILKK